MIRVVDVWGVTFHVEHRLIAYVVDRGVHTEVSVGGAVIETPEPVSELVARVEAAGD